MQQPFDLSGQVVAITGASSGFGHHFAGVLAEAGAKVILGARRTDKLAARVEEIIAGGGEAAAAALDVREKDSIGAFLDVAYETYGRLDCVINNAGVEAGAKTYHTIDEEDWDFVLEHQPQICLVGVQALYRSCGCTQAGRRQHHHDFEHHGFSNH
jgi:NADP-dependent 3-hydroxy acid dehydrogenase YdfG